MKFKIGDVVFIIGCDISFKINEILIQEENGSLAIRYSGICIEDGYKVGYYLEDKLTQ